MKKLIFSSIFLFTLSFLTAQPFQEHFINPLPYDADKNFPIDLDQDGDLDIVLLDEARETIYWLEQSEQGTLTQHVISAGIENVRSIFCVDMDNDGDVDILSASVSNSIGITWHQNDGNQNFAIQNLGFSSASDLFCIDLDQDGDIDIATTSFSSGRVKWLENDGSQNFSSYTLHSNIGDAAEGVFAADMDMDGDIDLLSANRSVSYYFENDGAQNFTKSTLSSDIYYGKEIFAIDMDGDGDLDPVIASANTNLGDSRIDWFRNMGDGNFTTQNIASSSIGNIGVSVAAGDIDGDGDNDVLWIGAGSDFLRARLNDGSGNFAGSYIVDYADANSLSIIDFDGDGHNDVLTGIEGNNFEYTNIWLKNNGDATFTSIPLLDNPEGRSLFVIDMDNDGDLDVLTDFALDRGLAWYQNDNQQFTRIAIDPDNSISSRDISRYSDFLPFRK